MRPVAWAESPNSDWDEHSGLTKRKMTGGNNNHLTVLAAWLLIGFSLVAADAQSLMVKSVGSVEKVGGGQQVTVIFSSPVEDASASAVGNYSLATGTITEAKLLTGLPKADAVGVADNAAPFGRVFDNTCVILSVQGLAAGAGNTLTVKNVKDRANPASAITSLAVPFKASAYKWTETGQLGTSAGRGQTPGQVIAVGDDGFDVFSNGGTQWANYDEVTFAFQEVTGDFDVKARLEFQDVSSRWARAGLMAREDLNSGLANPPTTTEQTRASRYADIHANPKQAFSDTAAGLVLGNYSIKSHFRADTGGQTDAQGGGRPNYPNVWLRLQRVGDTLKTYSSDDAENWELVVTRDVTGWNKKLYVGPSYCPETQDGNISPANGTEVKSRLFLAQYRFSPPAVPYVSFASPAVGALDVALDATLELIVADGGAPVNPNFINLTLDGKVVTPAITRSGTITSIRYKPAIPFDAASKHSGTLTVQDSASTPNVVAFPFNFATTLTASGVLYIEAEDFDYGGGNYMKGREIGMNGRYAGGAYQGLGAVEGIDYNEVNDNNEQAVYRGPTGVEAGKRMDAANAGKDALSRGSFEVAVNHVVGWNDGGDWYNFTRAFPTPAKVYKVYARLASGGLDEHAQLDWVTQGAKTPKQTLQFLGRFDAPPTGSWDKFQFAPMKDRVGNDALVKLGGEQTIRFTVLPGNLDVDYLMFVPVVGAGLPPIISTTTPAAGGTALGDDPIQIAISNRDSAVALNTIKLSVNGADVSRLANISATAGGATVRYQPVPNLAGGSTVNVRIEFADDSAAAAPQSSEWSYDVSVLTRDTLFIEAEDFNFDHGKYVTEVPIGMTGRYAGGAYQGKGNGLNGRLRDGSDFGIDYYEALPGSEQAVYRPNTGVETGKRGTTSAPVLVGLYRGAFDVEVNHVVGWNDAGDWYNYTRLFPSPPREYQVYARLASGSGSEAARLDEVTLGSAASVNQSLRKLGEFRSPASGGWDTFHFVPLRDTAGTVAKVSLGGRRSVRFTILPGSLDFDYLAFVPVLSAPILGATFTAIRREDDNVRLEWLGSGTLQSAEAVTGPWIDVIGATSPSTIPISGFKRFYRVKR